MKVTVIGGGSSYTPELINGFLGRVGSLPVKDLWLMDVDPERLAVVGGFAQRMAAARGTPFKVKLTTNQRDAVESASYVITQLRVGGMQARRNDEYLGRRHGLIGQETTGIGGMTNALRTIPVILNLAEDIRELAPAALLVNFTNPSGLVTEALNRYAPDVPAVGVCNAPITTKMGILKDLEQRWGREIALERAELNTLGLNHLSWHRGFVVGGEDVWPQVFAGFLERLRSEEQPHWDTRTIEVLGVIPNGYLEYYYDTHHKVAGQQGWPPSRRGGGDGDRGGPAQTIRRAGSFRATAGFDEARRRLLCHGRRATAQRPLQ